MIHFNPLNATERQAYLQEVVRGLQGPNAELAAVLAAVQRRIESLSSLTLFDEDRAALQAYLAQLAARMRSRDIDEGTAQLGMNRVIMAAAANSPDLASYIRAEV